MNQERLIGTAKRLDKILKVVQIVNIVGGVLVIFGFLLLNIAYLVNPENVNTADIIKFSTGEFSLELATGAEMGIDLAYGWVNCVWTVALLAILWIGFRYVRKIMVPMMEGNPFDCSISDYLKKLSFLTLVYGIIGNMGAAMITSMKMNHYQLERLVDGKNILAIIPEYRLELGFLIVFFVFLLASYIFRYGAELQQLSDETL